MTTTNTPRTDDRLCTISIENEDSCCAIYVKIDGKDSDCELIDADFTRQLERELTQSKAEVERLRGSLRDQERSLGTSQFYLARAIEIAEIVGWTQNVAYLSELRAELDALKATLNPDNK